MNMTSGNKSTEIRLYNTLTRDLQDLYSCDDKIRIYLCGVTVYDESHIGHARTIIVFDVLRRYLSSKGYSTNFVQNFTDVDDKIINRARLEGTEADEISSRYIGRYFRDFHSLNVLDADHYPLATRHISEIVELIKVLILKGFAYITLKGVYFRVKRFAGYGKLSKKSIKELEIGARVQIDSSKEDALDFALWKFSSERPFFESPWGKGRPGWHIECSAMALKYLGSTFEIHGGGSDLIFPHHENEIAQSESSLGSEFAKIWIHVGMVTVNSEKMSKSLGNIISIEHALKDWGMNTLRLYCISVQYSKPLDYTPRLLQEATQKWRQIETCGSELIFAEGKGGDKTAMDRLCYDSKVEFESAMNNDINTPLALTAFMKFVSKINQYAANDILTRDTSVVALRLYNYFMDIIGLKLVPVPEHEIKDIERLVNLRSNMRRNGRFEDSDIIRKELAEKYSVEIMDHKDRTIWKRVENKYIN
jgi:cysteinyl-tRNA synthetase